MRALVSPEQCCAYYSMLAAEQRLKVSFNPLFIRQPCAAEEKEGCSQFSCSLFSWNRSNSYKLRITDHFCHLFLFVYVRRNSDILLLEHYWISFLFFFFFNFSKDAGYGEKSLFSCDDDNDDPESKNIDDEVGFNEMEIHFKCGISYLWVSLNVRLAFFPRFAQPHGIPQEHLSQPWEESVSWLWQDLRTPLGVGRDFHTLEYLTSLWQIR